MTKLTLRNCAQDNVTVLENEFIDQYMVKANGEYVKVYLLVLRHLGESSGMLSISEMADVLECTEKDVLRALKYWKKQGILDYSEAYGEPTAAPAPSRETVSRRPSRDDKEFKELLFVAEQYLGKTLSSTDIDTITYFFDSLNMTADLIEYLIEYCVENGHKSMHYIRAVALSWDSQNIRTVEEAKSVTVQYHKNYYSVLKAYGIGGRAPAASEIAYIRKWNDEYGFSLDIILEACARTMSAIHQPNFEYTDSILKNWQSKNVRHLKDIEAVDADFQKEKEKKAASREKHSMKSARPNKFNNFDGRSYDMNDLERRLIQQ
nr:DnaD domain protein [uncultured Merdimonas sp.]